MGFKNKSISTQDSGLFLTLSHLFSEGKISVGRVKSIILNENHPRFKELGEWNGLGTIEFDSVNNPSTIENIYPTAKPLSANIKNYPLINEIIYLISLPDNNLNSFTNSQTSYYMGVTSLWNHPHHNAYPENPNILAPSQDKDYKQIEAGSIRQVTDNSTEIFLGETFKEKTNIHPLLPFEGDFIEEGRWGNSIRLGSTVNVKSNDWSSVGTNGNPITIIRNGQGKQSEEGWIPVSEKINNDNSSIYLTNGQKIPISVASSNYNSYINAPIAPDNFVGDQIILSSGRLLFNAKEDHILLTAKKSVGINTEESFNVDTKNTIINSKKILLGSKTATEPLLLGDTTINLLSELVDQLTKLTTALVTVTPTGGPAVSAAASQLIPYLIGLKIKLETTTKSKISKTI